ncbi:hypothetical protein [Romboutsia weinsteinii]|uniref:hypothetical protein n=1 Tax=Romboutsia weinsteinii TaxID=2020949 RepID=UPI0011C0814C|nr:hypothetical protein [Romboutsia weinsteinii]
MNVKITYKHEKSDNSNEDRLYKLMCNIIKKDIQKNNVREVEADEEECMSNEGIYGYARNISTENSNRKVCSR